MKKILVITDLLHNPASQAEYSMLLSLAAFSDIELFILGEIDKQCIKELEQAGIHYFSRKPRKKFEPSLIRYIRSILVDQNIDTLFLSSIKGVGNGAFAAINLPVRVISYRGAARVHWHDPLAYITTLHPRIDLICCLSGFIKKSMEEQMKIVNKECVVVHKGMDASIFQEVEPANLSAFGIEKDTITIACAAEWRKVKGLNYLLQAIRLLSEENIHLILMGKGTDCDEARKLLIELDIADKVSLMGHSDQVYSLVKAADIYVQPSLKEGLGRALLEAMFLKKAIIATESGGPQELVEDQKSALLVPIADAEALANAIKKLLNNPKLRLSLAEEANTRANQQFTVEAYANNIHDLLVAKH